MPPVFMINENHSHLHLKSVLAQTAIYDKHLSLASITDASENRQIFFSLTRCKNAVRLNDIVGLYVPYAMSPLL